MGGGYHGAGARRGNNGIKKHFSAKRTGHLRLRISDCLNGRHQENVVFSKTNYMALGNAPRAEPTPSHFTVSSKTNYMTQGNAPRAEPIPSHFIVFSKTNYMAQGNAPRAEPTPSHFIVSSKTNYMAQGNAPRAGPTPSHFIVSSKTNYMGQQTIRAIRIQKAALQTLKPRCHHSIRDQP